MPRYDLVCVKCKNEQLDMFHSIHEPHPVCSLCGGKNETLWRQAPSVIGDACDVYLKHGLCWPDGTPKRYTSKSEIRQAAFDTGYSQGGDTPKVNQRFVDGAGMRELAKHK